MKCLRLLGGLLALLLACPAPAVRSQSSLLPPPNDYNFVHPPSIVCGDQNVDLSYKVELPPEQERRAMDLYRNAIVILAHSHCVETWDFDEMSEAGLTGMILKVDVDGINILNGVRSNTPANEDWFSRGSREMRRILELAARPNSKILIVRSVDDLLRAKREGKVGIILSFEGGRPLAGKLENVKYFYDLGMRDMQLWWAVPNELKTPDQYYLSRFGLDVIREMNRLGIVIDLSHMVPQGFGPALATTRRPVVISHCAVAFQAGTELSNTDELNDASIRAMAKNGGSICLHFFTGYIHPRHGTPQATVEDLVDHVAYIRDLVGIDYVSLGADFFPELGYKFVLGAGRISQLPNVAREMVRRGLTDEEITKVLGGNLLRVLEHNWGPAYQPGPAIRAATSAAAGVPGPLVPGGLHSLWGAEMAGATSRADRVPLPAQMCGIEVRITDSEKKEFTAPLLYCSPQLIHFQVPGKLAPGLVRVSLVGEGGARISFNAIVGDSNPAIFIADPAQNAGAVIVATGPRAGQLVTADAPARPGDFLSVYATGLGAVDPPPPADGSPAAGLHVAAQPVTASLGGREAPVLFAGLAPGFAGVYQVNLQVPAGISAGSLSLTLAVGNRLSNAVTLAVGLAPPTVAVGEDRPPGYRPVLFRKITAPTPPRRSAAGLSRGTSRSPGR